MPQTSLDIILPRLLLGLILSALIGVVAYRRGSLSRSGVLGAIIIGTLIFGFGGLISGLLLIAFFVSSSLLSRFRESNAQKQKAAESFDKGGQRDLAQALANGGAATVCAVMSGLSIGNSGVWTAAFIGALATANADTWATELGVLSKSPPHLITRPSQIVAPGVSGGVTAAGTLAALAGGAFIGLCYVVFTMLYRIVIGPAHAPNTSVHFASIFVIATVAGLAGALFDSLLGATAQAMYFSDTRNKETEKSVERDGAPNRLIRGWRWLNNDWVNFISSLVGAGAAALVAIVLVR